VLILGSQVVYSVAERLHFLRITLDCGCKIRDGGGKEIGFGVHGSGEKLRSVPPAEYLPAGRGDCSTDETVAEEASAGAGGTFSISAMRGR
jgi:hypothetical protein